MHLIAFTLRNRASRGPVALPEQELLAALWSACRPDDGIEHIRVHPSRFGARGVLFCLGEDSAQATAGARSLCERAVGQVAALSDWELCALGPALDGHDE